MRLPLHLIIAWLASACALALAFAAWMFITTKMEGSPPPKSFLGVWLWVFGAGLLIQLLYGGLVYVVLSRSGIFTFWAVLIAYVAPVLLFSWRASDTYQDIIGTVPWVVFAVLVASVFWLFASGRLFRGAVL